MSDSAIERVVVAGSGQAAIELAASLRQRGFSGSITIVGDEPDLPYQRPPLSKDFLSSTDSATLPLRAEKFYADNVISLKLGETAERIDRPARELILMSGERIGYDHLVLATGARNRIPAVPGLDPADVMELRTLAHARQLTEKLDRLSHVTVLGGGFIGLEVASLLRARDIEVELIEASDRLMGRVLSPQASGWFSEFHAGLGTRVRFETRAGEVARQDGRFAIKLSDGDTVRSDAIMVAVGVLPNAEMAAEAGLEVNNGVVVDEMLATADPAISAIGDCAAHPNPFGLGMVRLESVQNAVDQARTVAARLTGAPAPYDSLPWFWSNQGSVRLQIAGLAADVDDAIIRGDPASGRFSVFLYRGDRLVTVESINMAAEHMASRRILAARHSMTKDQAADPATDLKALMPKAAIGSAA